MFSKIPPVVFASALTSGPREIEFTPPSPEPPHVYYYTYYEGLGNNSGDRQAAGEGLDTISFLGNVGIGTSTPQYRLDVQNGSARFSRTRIMPVADAVIAGNAVTLRLSYPAVGTLIYGEFRGTIASQASLYSPTTTTGLRISFKVVSSSSSASASTMGDVSLLGSSVLSVTMPTTTATTTTIRLTMNSTGSWFVSGDLLLVESQNAIARAAWE
jgi:hypothetical protein